MPRSCLVIALVVLPTISAPIPANAQQLHTLYFSVLTRNQTDSDVRMCIVQSAPTNPCHRFEGEGKEHGEPFEANRANLYRVHPNQVVFLENLKGFRFEILGSQTWEPEMMFIIGVSGEGSSPNFHVLLAVPQWRVAVARAGYQKFLFDRDGRQGGQGSFFLPRSQ